MNPISKEAIIADILIKGAIIVVTALVARAIKWSDNTAVLAIEGAIYEKLASSNFSGTGRTGDRQTR